MIFSHLVSDQPDLEIGLEVKDIVPFEDIGEMAKRGIIPLSNE